MKRALCSYHCERNLQQMKQATECRPFPEIWGGIECTINRTSQGYFDQLAYAGHYERWASDIEKIASLGIRAVRYPVLWEEHQPAKGQEIDWEGTVARLGLIRQKGIEPIIGLLHHGSGPAYTDLLDPEFPKQLAAYARQVAEQFPWVNYYTPVNEPLTTARFSGLYGFWYPHHTKDTSFVKMLLHQMKAVILCMQAIRQVNPRARLVQTEDLAKTYSGPALAYQAAFENERRWLSFDLLCGKVLPGTTMYNYLQRLGITAAELHFFEQHACPPDILGMNYYLTSERYLDDRLELHAPHTHGGNELQEYADVEAVRVPHGQPSGLKVLMEEAWERYKLPLALTECHLHCSREEQLRWLESCQQQIMELRAEGVDVKALTVWALLGSFGWDQLLTSPSMNYESGVFDISSGTARETALAPAVRQMASGKKMTHPLCNVPGWWVKDTDRKEPSAAAAAGIETEIPALPPILIIGKSGTLARAFAHICSLRNIPFVCAGRNEIDISNYKSLEALLQENRPWAVINTAGYVNIDGAEEEEENCLALNTAAPVLMASLCHLHDLPFMTFSTDQVFDGSNWSGYFENDLPHPINVYGRSKLQQEELVMALHPRSCIIRTSAFFGPWDEHNFVWRVITALQRGETVEAAGDVYVSPTYVPDLVSACLNMLIDGESGIFHLANKGSVSWAAFAKQVAKMAGLESRLVKSIPASKTGWLARRPVYSALESQKGQRMPELTDGLRRFFLERQLQPAGNALVNQGC